MRYQTFGRRTGLRVSEYVLGTANFGTSDGSAGLEGSRQIFEAFTDAGGTTIDTSNIYRGGEAETVLGGLLGARRDEYVVITKYSGTRQPGVLPTATGNSRKVMVRSVEESLRRLKTDYVDVYMPHFPDGTTPIEEILTGFDDLIRAGKILHAGLSNFPAWREAGAAVRSQTSLIGIQTEYSLAERSGEREMLPMAQAHGLGVVSYSPLAGGLLTGKYRKGEAGRLSARGDSVEGSAQRSQILDTVLAVADEIGTGAAQVALAWVRRRAALAATAMIPIVGPRTPAQFEDYLKALEVELGDEHYRRLDEVSAVRLGTPHEDVEGALEHGADGNRDLLRAPGLPVV